MALGGLQTGEEWHAKCIGSVAQCITCVTEAAEETEREKEGERCTSRLGSCIFWNRKDGKSRENNLEMPNVHTGTDGAVQRQNIFSERQRVLLYNNSSLPSGVKEHPWGRDSTLLLSLGSIFVAGMYVLQSAATHSE